MFRRGGVFWGIEFCGFVDCWSGCCFGCFIVWVGFYCFVGVLFGFCGVVCLCCLLCVVCCLLFVVVWRGLVVILFVLVMFSGGVLVVV